MTDAATPLETERMAFKSLSRRLMIGAAALAIVTAGQSQRAAAQSFKGTPDVTLGGATVSISDSKTTVNINAQLTAINWQPSDTSGTGTILFQPAGTIAEFNSANFSDFTVLNRILPVDSSGNPVITRPIRFDGTVNSTFGLGTSTTAGSIWFYTPGGIIVGGSSAFNVGSLVLSTSDINPASLFTGNAGTINFTGTPNVASTITVEASAQINALINRSSYVAMVAPRIVQNGNVNVNGSVAYVAAEQADITINSGLFDISVTVGTSDANGVVHTGTTTGPASAPTPAGPGNDPPAISDAQAIYAVALPKNAAMTMLLSGNIGYQPAASAAVVNGSVILSAGANVSVDGSLANPGINIDTTAPQNFSANINVTNAFFSSDVTGFAGNDITVNAGANSNVAAINAVGTQSINLSAGNNLTVIANGGFVAATKDINLNAGKTLTLNAIAGGNIFALNDMILSAGTGNVGGTINIIAQDGGVISGRSAILSAYAISGQGGDGIGGNILLNVNNGSINFADFVSADVSGVGGFGVDFLDPLSIGFGQGGTIRLLLEGAAGSMSFNDLYLLANGSIQGNSDRGAPEFEGDGGSGTGGSVIFDIMDGTFSANGIFVSADGTGGFGGNLVTPPLTTAAFSIAAAGPGFVSAGNGGAGTGGNVTFNLNGGNATVTDLSISANGLGGDGATGDYNAGTNGGNGGSGTGGNATFNANSGTLSVTNLLSIEALGNAFSSGGDVTRGGSGGFGNGSDGGAGGNGIGGSATFNLNQTAIVDAGSVLISSDGFGGEGGSSQSTTDIFNNFIQGGMGGAGGNGMGGNAVFNNSSGTINFGDLSVQSLGSGGVGGSNFSGFSSGPADNDGGNGGIGTGGTASINLNQDDVTFPTYRVDASATGGNGGAGLNSGDGGNAVGGVASLNINNANILLDDPAILANATGGNGGSVDGPSGQGGNGGNAIGGTARLEVTGANGFIPVNFILLQSEGLGGDGGAGGGNFTGGIAGNGGNGGDATGGNSELIARAGGEIDILTSAFVHSSSGTGGSGGAGGNIDMVSGGTAGDGGDGGDGTGGVPYILAQGGTINAQDITINGQGFGGTGGPGGTDFTVTLGTDGVDGIGNGGLAIVEVQEGSPGIINFGPTTIEVSGAGGFGGRIQITDTSTDPAGLITFDNLTATALGLNNPGYTGFFLSSNSGAITINGNAIIDISGNAEFAFANDGQFVVIGGMNVTSGAGSILVSHSNNAPNIYSIDVGSALTALAAVDFSSGAGSRIRSVGDMYIGTGANIFAADLTAVDHMTLQAGQNAELVDGLLMASGVGNPPIQILINAGVAAAASAAYDPNYNATISGTVVSAGNVVANAGGNIFIRSTANISADDRVQLRSGDDIIIESGASIAAAVNPTSPLNIGSPFLSQAIIEISAGALGSQLSSPILTPISSIISAGNLNANASAVVLSANAIDGLGGTITASSVSADILNAPSNAQIALTGQSTDNGLLSAQCVEGNVCLGDLFADNIIQIGQNSPNDVVQAVIEGGTVAANSFLLTTRRDILIGTAGAASSITAGSQIAVTSTQGNVDLQDSSLSSDLLQISAVAGSLLGSGSLLSANDIGITVGSSISATSINTGRELTTVANMGGALEGFYSVLGDMNVGALAVGAGDVNYSAANFTFGQINVPGTDIILVAPGSIAVGDTNGAANVNIDAGSMALGTIDGANDIALNAATSIDFVSLFAGGNVNLSAGAITGGTISGGDINAVATGSFQSSGINAASALISAGQNAIFNGAVTSATTFDVLANQQAVFNGIVSAQNIGVSSGNIAIGNTTQLGVIGITQSVDLSNSAGAQMTLGGSGVATGYSLSGAEMVRIFANNINIGWTNILATTGVAVAPPAGGFAGPNILLDSFTLSSRTTNAAGNIATNGAISVSSPGTMQIVGAVALTGAGANNSLRLNSGQTLQIISSQGSVGINDGTGGLAGTLSLSAQTIVAASASAINDIAGLTDPTMIDLRLGLNDGYVSDTGMISAARVNFGGASNVYIQNSGTSILYRDRRGITANAININLANPNGQIIINGRITGSAGFVSGIDAIPLLSINASPSQQATGFDSLSTMNGCQITAIAVCRQRENPISVTKTGINEPLDPDHSSNNQFPTTLIEVKEFESFGYPPLLDEPVTGSGNDDLWPATCTNDDQNPCEPLTSDTQ